MTSEFIRTFNGIYVSYLSFDYYITAVDLMPSEPLI